MAARLTAYAVAFIVGVTFIAGLIVGAQREDDGPVDLIVINGQVYASDGGSDLAEAVAVRGNKVIRVGSNREIQRLGRAQTTVIDAKGGAVMAGFNDAHAHLINGGLSLDQVNLIDATTLDDVKDTIRRVGGVASRARVDHRPRLVLPGVQRRHADAAVARHAGSRSSGVS